MLNKNPKILTNLFFLPREREKERDKKSGFHLAGVYIT